MAVYGIYIYHADVLVCFDFIYALVLGLPSTATDEEITRAYRKLSLENHPDRGGDQLMVGCGTHVVCVSLFCIILCL